MAVTAELLTKIKDYRNQGYTPDEIVQGLAQSSTFPDVAKKVKAYAKGGYPPDDILQGIQTSPIAKGDADRLRSKFMAEEGGPDYTARERKKFIENTATPKTAKANGVDVSNVDGVPEWGREHPNLYAVYKTATGGIDLSAPTAPAESVSDFVTRVVPESAVKTTVGAVMAPYQMVKNITDPVVDYAANIANTDPKRPTLSQGLEQGVQSNLSSMADFMGKPLGFKRGEDGQQQWSLANIKDAVLTDPVGTGVAAAGLAGIGKGAASEVKAAWDGRVPKLDKLTASVDKEFTKAVRPSVQGNRTAAQSSKYADNARTAVKEIVLNKDNLGLKNEVGEPLDTLPQNLGQFRQAIDSTKRNLWNKVEAINAAAGEKGAQVPLDSAVTELAGLADKPVYKTMLPETVSYAAKRAEALGQQGAFSVAEAQDAITLANQSVKNFDKNPSADTASKAYVDSLIANHLRANLDTALEQTTGTPAAAPLRKSYGALKTIERDVNQRATVDARKNNRGLIDFADIYTAGELVNAMASLHPAGMAKAGTMAAVKALIKRANDPNTHVKNLFKAADKLVSKVDIPRPEPTVTPVGTVQRPQTVLDSEAIPAPSQGNLGDIIPGGYQQTYGWEGKSPAQQPLPSQETLPAKSKVNSLGDMIPTAPATRTYGWDGRPALAEVANPEVLPGRQSSAVNSLADIGGRIVPQSESMTKRVPEGFNPEVMVGRESQLGDQLNPAAKTTAPTQEPAAPQTWKEYLTVNMAKAMKKEGSHGAAMKRLAKEWQGLKANRDSN